jgi:RNA polymerase I-specific transcription initiation factor RRN7
MDGDLNRTPERPFQAMRLTDENDDLKPGERYKIWNAREVLGVLPKDYAVVVESAARWIGSTEEYLEGVIEMYEKRVFRWYEKKQRKPRQRMEEDGDSSSSVNES